MSMKRSLALLLLCLGCGQVGTQSKLITHASESFPLSNGTIVGNGGDVIVCEGKTSVEMLDTYEARKYRMIMPSLGGTTLSVREKVNLALDRSYSKLAPSRHQYLIEKATEFFTPQATRFVRNVDLPDLNDSGGVILERGCKIKQIAIQQKPTVSSDPYYIIDEELWERMDADNQAILVLHELLYRLQLLEGDLDSRNARLVNAHTFSESFATMKSEAYLTFWQSVRAYVPGSKRFMGLQLKDEPSLFHSNTLIPQKFFVDPKAPNYHTFHFFFGEVYLSSSEVGFKTSPDGSIISGSTFRPLKAVSLSKDTQLNGSLSINWWSESNLFLIDATSVVGSTKIRDRLLAFNGDYDFETAKFEYIPEERKSRLTGVSVEDALFRIGDQEYLINRISTDFEGTPTKVRLAKDGDFWIGGQLVTVPVGGFLSLKKDGSMSQLESNIVRLNLFNHMSTLYRIYMTEGNLKCANCQVHYKNGLQFDFVTLDFPVDASNNVIHAVEIENRYEGFKAESVSKKSGFVHKNGEFVGKVSSVSYDHPRFNGLDISEETEIRISASGKLVYVEKGLRSGHAVELPSQEGTFSLVIHSFHENGNARCVKHQWKPMTLNRRDGSKVKIEPGQLACFDADGYVEN